MHVYDDGFGDELIAVDRADDDSTWLERLHGRVGRKAPDPIEWGDDFKRLTPQDIAKAHMRRIDTKMELLNQERQSLAAEYVSWQKKAYPASECRHGPKHVCPNCLAHE